MRGQLSAEMLIILVLILGIAFIAFTQMSKNVKDVGAASDKKTQQLIDSTTLLAQEVPCIRDADCEKFNDTWRCDEQEEYCTGN